jgi:hypothetical protein
VPTLEQRVSDLEQRTAKTGEPCFWCECERGESTESAACTHRDWNPVPHETALTELK